MSAVEWLVCLLVTAFLMVSLVNTCFGSILYTRTPVRDPWAAAFKARQDITDEIHAAERRIHEAVQASEDRQQDREWLR